MVLGYRHQSLGTNNKNKDKMIDASKLQELINSVRKRETDKVPQGFHTAKEHAAKWGLSESQAKRWLDAGVRDGLIEAKSFRILLAHKKTYIVTHYRSKTCTSRKK